MAERLRLACGCCPLVAGASTGVVAGGRGPNHSPAALAAGTGHPRVTVKLARRRGVETQRFLSLQTLRERHWSEDH
jgi:hypothetical protein